MKKILLLIITITLGNISIANAQEANDNNQIITTNKKGEQIVTDVPEGMTNQLDSLLNLYYTKTYLKRDANCNSSDVNPEYSDSVYKERLKRLPTIIEMPYNEVVRKFIDRYTGHLRNHVSAILGASNFYIPIFEQALEAYQLPLELKYLPVIESGLNPKAVSRAGAAGLWQFMIGTGKRYGLEINSLVDERRDIIKSSYAAAQYLSDLYKIYGNWNLVIAAYNAGPDKINRAINRAGGQTDYWQIYPYLPNETRGYLPAFIAANYVMTYYCDHNICPMITTLPAKSDTIMINHDVTFSQIATALNIDEKQLEELNTQYRHNMINGSAQPYSLRLPVSLINKFISNQNTIYASNTGTEPIKRTDVEINKAPPVYTHASSNRRERRYSHHSRSDRHSKRERRRDRHHKTKDVTVRNGDSLSEIAERHHTTVKKLRKLNKIHGSGIRAGKKIRLK